MSKEINRMKIGQRDDGEVFTYAREMDTNSRFTTGQLVTYEDGTQKVELDKLSARDLKPGFTSGRERVYQDQIEELKRQLAIAQGLTPEPSIPRMAPTLDPGEVGLPPDEEVVDFTPSDEVPIEAVKLADEPEMLTAAQLNDMTRAQLVTHIKEIDYKVSTPANANKAALVDIALNTQNAYVERTAPPAPAPGESPIEG